MASKDKVVFFCNECGYESSKYWGKCPACGKWNTFVEQKIETAQRYTASNEIRNKTQPVKIRDIDITSEIRFTTGSNELDRVLGGGAVSGSLVLVGGEPGIGKSTLMLQLCGYVSQTAKVLYVSGEESQSQIKLRAKRLDVFSDNLFVHSETELENVLNAVNEYKPQVLVVDSIQTVYTNTNDSAPGSVSQIKECTMSLMRLAKETGITVFVIGHVNKDGAIAGPKILEHMVDCVLYFEGDSHMSYRIIRAAKNRFGSTNEIGVFEMKSSGLEDVLNPSEMLLSGRPKGVAGTCVACILEGTRPVLSEVQSLITPSGYGTARRMVDGVDYNRAVLMMAVLEKRMGMVLSSSDAYINVVGGLKLDEPATDLPILLAVASAFKNKPISEDTAAFGEVGLAGELRAVNATEQRLSEIYRLGFKKCIIPFHKNENIIIPEGLEVIRVSNIKDAVNAIM